MAAKAVLAKAVLARRISALRFSALRVLGRSRLGQELKRQFGGGLDLLHDEACRYVDHVDAFDQLLIKPVISRNVGNSGMEDVVDVAGGAVGGDDLGDAE